MSYYTVLDLSTDCTLEEIKKSYKQLAKIFHPDKNQSDGGAKFKSISEAYKLEVKKWPKVLIGLIYSQTHERLTSYAPQKDMKLPWAIFNQRKRILMREFKSAILYLFELRQALFSSHPRHFQIVKRGLNMMKG